MFHVPGFIDGQQINVRQSVLNSDAASAFLQTLIISSLR